MVPLLTCKPRPSVTDTLCEGYIFTLRLAEDVLPKLSNFIQFHRITELRAFTSSTHLGWSHFVVILSEGTPFLWEIDIDV